jgi:hypothetical protein
LKLIIEAWKPSLSKIKNINEKHSLALHIHEQSQKIKHIKKILQKNAFFMPTPYNKSTILENASHSRKDKTLLTKHD